MHVSSCVWAVLYIQHTKNIISYKCAIEMYSTFINTASASKVGQFRPFLGEVKKTKRSADEYFSFQIQECGSTTLETTLDAFCERSFLAGCYKCGDIKVVYVDETIFHHNRKTAIITLYKPS